MKNFPYLKEISKYCQAIRLFFMSLRFLLWRSFGLNENMTENYSELQNSQISKILLCVSHPSDPTTLYRARTEYQSELDRFLKTEHTGEKQSLLPRRITEHNETRQCCQNKHHVR